ncbi:uncharacterized protein LOC116203925 isoform X2 [Punica granatum]|uniref:Uncharacterized protein n=2 Tax=Punica granatum TaxID=22663 RepID=A0A2I0IC07_PUNGR|nr:uncharacterized protein LOC116203925 isoform X2 [Punica granatum]PKI41528.1 hypothetical protein CRG98_038039 [Punica granatum]
MDLLGLVKKLWKAWNLKGVILLSLSLQTFLILFGSLRKRTANTVAIMFIWIAYLLADWAASFAVGLISKAQGAAPPGEGDNADLLAFWAPFLLVHLGGPDTITAFSLEDNELWLRHFLGLAFQVAAAVYIFSQAFPENKLLFPTILLFISGTIKFVERTRALYLASAKSFRESMLTEPDPGPNYAKLMDEYSSKLEANLPTKIIMIAERNNRIASQKVEAFGASDDYELDNIEIVKQAYRQFKTFKGLIVDLIFSFRERDNSRAFFHNTKAEEALSLIEVELNFFYDVLYTKIVVVRQKVGYICRFVCFACVAIALFLFYGMDKKGFHTSNIDITFTLLIGALSLDLIALLQMIFSDWTVANLSEESSILTSIFMKYLSLKRSTWSTNRESNNSWMSTRCLRWITNRFFRRWCGSIPKYNLIEYCIQEHPKEVHEFHDYPRILFNKVIGYLGMKDLLDHIRYVSRKTFTEKLWNFIFEELKKKSLVAADPDVAKGIFSARGEWVLRDIECRELMRYIADVEYDESLLLWHIATELCYNLDTRRSGSNSDDSCREFSKTLSDYMLYLLVVQSAMMVSIAGIGQIRFRDTCAEAEKFFASKELSLSADMEQQGQQASKYILAVNTSVRPVDVKGDRSKSVLFEASRLAKELNKMEEKKKWETVSRVWVELLSYAASHCRAAAHAQQLSKGGELATFVWLLMAHFGLGEQFQINEGHARAKLIVRK